jgi:hypothetical protein
MLACGLRSRCRASHVAALPQPKIASSSVTVAPLSATRVAPTLRIPCAALNRSLTPAATQAYQTKRPWRVFSRRRNGGRGRGIPTMHFRRRMTWLVGERLSFDGTGRNHPIKLKLRQRVVLFRRDRRGDCPIFSCKALQHGTSLWPQLHCSKRCASRFCPLEGATMPQIPYAGASSC